MIITAFSYSGFYIAKMKRERLAALRELNSALGILYAELNSKLSPMDDIASNLASTDGRYAPCFFRKVHERMCSIGEMRFCEIWSESAREVFNCLERDELNNLCALAYVLGAYEISEQLSSIELCRASIAKKAELAGAELIKNERTSIGVCSVLGILAAVALM